MTFPSKDGWAIQVAENRLGDGLLPMGDSLMDLFHTREAARKSLRSGRVYGWFDEKARVVRVTVAVRLAESAR